MQWSQWYNSGNSVLTVVQYSPYTECQYLDLFEEEYTPSTGNKLSSLRECIERESIHTSQAKWIMKALGAQFAMIRGPIP